ncbi:ArsR/SmtB family transcription factor [Aestuariibius insulae]|uniref:ArsR/SmtB family transcription factor n=1 Tax=Aestuariibius insulae TaxID=2058287 RepID=UPI00345E4690
MTYEVAIVALADPSRRAIVDILRHGPAPVSELAKALPISRPAVSQHLRVLSDAGLLTVAQHGTRRYYAISPEGLEDLRRYLDHLWDDALSAFRDDAVKHSEKKANK